MPSATTGRRTACKKLMMKCPDCGKLEQNCFRDARATFYFLCSQTDCGIAWKYSQEVGSLYWVSDANRQ